MRVLLTNDDGIYAPGLAALEAALRPHHDLYVVAPESEQSAVGHAITLADPIRVKTVHRNGRVYGQAISGTPADCVRLGVGELLDRPPDLVLSGINRGANTGINILYSGTVSAATEGALLGIPAMAFSLNQYQSPDFSYAAEAAVGIVARLPELGLSPGVALNVNFPALPRERIKGFAWAAQSLSVAGEAFERRVDPRGNVYYWRGTEIPPDRLDPDSDQALLTEGYVTLTPLRYDLTARGELKRLSLHSWTVD